MNQQFPELMAACSSLQGLNDSTATHWVAYSGGCDSHVLLHLMSQLRDATNFAFTLKAVHVNHSIHSDSGMWAGHCEQVCKTLQIPLKVFTLEAGQVSELKKTAGSEENAARKLRYEMFEQVMDKGDFLLMAHHADDQLETFFYRLIRGSGMTGLAAIPEYRMLGLGTLVRPLLAFPRNELETYARHYDLAFLNDPANESMVHDRNYIRHEVFPVLEKRWPGFGKSWMRSCGLMKESDGLLGQLAEADLGGKLSENDTVLSLNGSEDLDNPRLRNMIRFWLRKVCQKNQWPTPDHVSLSRIANEVIGAAPSAMPEVRWPKGQPVCEIRRYDNCLYLLPVLPPVPESLVWRELSQSLLLPQGLGRLVLKPVKQQGFRLEPGQCLTVVFDAEGLQVRPYGERTRSFRKYCQQKRIPPWKRNRVPLIFRGDDLVSVGNWFIQADQLHDSASDLYQIHWLNEELD